MRLGYSFDEFGEEWDKEQQTVEAIVEIGAERGMDIDGLHLLPEYNLQARCSRSVERDNPCEYYYFRTR